MPKKKEIKVKAAKEEKPVVPQNTSEAVNATTYGVVMYKDKNSYAVIVDKEIKEIHIGVDAFNVASKNFAQNYKP